MTIPETTNDSSGKVKRGPDRLCIATQKTLSRDHGLRFVISPDQMCVFDVNAKLPGRGVWVGATKDNLEKAIKTGAFARSFKRPLSIPKDLSSKVEVALLKKCQQHLSLCVKSGEIVLGAENVENFLHRTSGGATACLLQASNGDEASSFRLARKTLEINPDIFWSGALSGEELGAATGKGFLAHGLIKSGRMAKIWISAYKKLVGFRFAPELAWKKQLNPINTPLVVAN